MEAWSKSYQSNSLKTKSISTSAQKLVRATAGTTHITTTQCTTTKTVAASELSTITETFLDKLKTGLSSFAQCLLQENVVFVALHSLAKLYLPICQQIDYWKTDSVRTKQSSLKMDINDL